MSKNKRLYDMLIAQQIFIEQIKNDFDYNFRKRIPTLVKELKKIFSEVDVNNIGDLTRRELVKLTKAVDSANVKFHNRYLRELEKELRSFMTEVRASNLIITAEELAKASENQIEDESEAISIIKEDMALDPNLPDREDDDYPLTWIFGKNDEAFFDKTFFSTPMGATGITPNAELNSLRNITSVALIAAVNKGWSNNLSKQQVLDSILGTKENNLKDGLLLRIEANNSAILRTIQQNIVSEIEYSLQKLIWNKYKWVSILDSRTSEICRYLSGKIFEYGKGPVPPRHIRCRSKIVPVSSGVPSNPETFLTWLKRQPREDQISLVGIKKANALRDGLLKDSDFLKIDDAVRLKPSDLRNKLKTLTR